MKKSFSFPQCAAVVLLCTGVLSTGISLYVNQLTHLLKKETILILQEFAAQDARNIEQQVSEDLHLLSSVATSLSLLPQPTPEELLRFLQVERQQNNYKNMEFVRPDGVSNLDDGSLLELSREPHFQKAMAGEANISQRVSDYLDRESILVESAPVIQQDKIVGVLMGTRKTADFAHMLDMQSFGGLGYSLLINSNGDKIIESFHKNALRGLYNIFDIPSDPDHALRHQILQDFAARKQGVATYHSKTRGTLYISYQPLTVNDWYLISVVPQEHITQVTSSFVTLLPMLCLLVALAAFILGAYLCYVWPAARAKLTSPEE